MAGAKPAAKAKTKHPKSPTASIALGKKVYEKANCGMCHSIAGKGQGLDLTHVGKTRKAAWLKTQIRTPKKNNPASAMPAFDAKRIGDKDLSSLVGYLVSLK